MDEIVTEKPDNLRKAAIAASLLPALVAFIVYIPSLKNGFVNWDDDIYVVQNERSKSP